MVEQPYEDLFYQPAWRRAGAARGTASAAGGTWLLFEHDEGGLKGLGTLLAEAGGEPVFVRPGAAFRRGPATATIDPRSPDHHHDLIDQVGGGLRGVVHAWASDQSGEPEEPSPSGLLSALYLVQALVRTEVARRTRLFLVTRGAQSVRPAGDSVAPAQTTMWGLGRSAAFEHPTLRTALIDLDPEPGEQEVDLLAHELLSESGAEEVALRGHDRYVCRLARLEMPRPSTPQVSMREDGGYLIVGGLGGLGLTTARWMAQRGAGRLALMQRRAPDADGLREVEALRRTGATVEVVQGDVTDADDVARALSAAGRECDLRGVVHSAAALDDAPIVSQTGERFETVLSPKVRGSLNLHRQTASAELDLFVLFSSGASFIGPPGQSNYSAANNFIDGLAARRRADGLPATAVNWGAWSEVGGAARLGLMSVLERFGLAPISPSEGMVCLERLIAAGVGQALVLKADWTRFVDAVWLGDGPPLLAELDGRETPAQPREHRP